MSKEEDPYLKEALEVLGLARARIRNTAPYYSSLLYSLVYRPYTGLYEAIRSPMACTAEFVVIYEPQWVAEAGEEIIAGALVHEMGHLLRNHHERISAIAPDPPSRKKGNIAADLTINPNLLHGGWKLPDWIVLPEQYDLPEGLTLEEYFEQLPDEPETGSSAGKGGDSGDGNFTEGVGGGNCGSAAGNVDPDNLGVGDTEDLNKQQIEAQMNQQFGRQPDEIHDALQQTRETISRDKNIGREAAGITDEIEEETQGKIPWTQELQKVVQAATGNIIAGGFDFSMRFISKRSYTTGIIRPGLIEQEVIPFFVRDTSGSMSEEDIAVANAEAVGVMRSAGVDRAWLLDADAQIYEPRLVQVNTLLKLPVIGRGGTSFKPAFEFAEKMKPKPDLIIYLTDGYGDAPEKPPSIPTIWCIIVTHGSRGGQPTDWGHYVLCSDDPQASLERVEW